MTIRNLKLFTEIFRKRGKVLFYNGIRKGSEKNDIAHIIMRSLAEVVHLDYIVLV